MNKTRYSATEFGGNKPMNFRPSGTLKKILSSVKSKQPCQVASLCNVMPSAGLIGKIAIDPRSLRSKRLELTWLDKPFEGCRWGSKRFPICWKPDFLYQLHTDSIAVHMYLLIFLFIAWLAFFLDRFLFVRLSYQPFLWWCNFTTTTNQFVFSSSFKFCNPKGVNINSNPI